MTDEDRKPWQYGHPTYTTIEKGRPITAEEAKELLAEISRLQQVEYGVRQLLQHSGNILAVVHRIQHDLGVDPWVPAAEAGR